MNEDEAQLDKFLYGDEYSNLNNNNELDGNVVDDEEEIEEEEEDDYEIILDSSKITSNNSGGTDINKRSLTSVSIDEGKGEETGGAGASGNSTVPSSATAATLSHFDPFAPANLNGAQLYDHDLENFEDKPWRKPGADLTDYFNFGFNEVTWRAYCIKQKALREEFGLQKKIGVYDSSGVGAGSAIGSSSSLNSGRPPQRDYNRRPPNPMSHQQPQHDPRGYGQQQDSRGYGQQQDPRGYGQQQQEYRGHSHHAPSHHQDVRDSRDSRDYSRSRSRHDSPSPPPPPPPSSSRHVTSRDRSRSRSRSPDAAPQRRYVSRSRYDDAPRSPPR